MLNHMAWRLAEKKRFFRHLAAAPAAIASGCIQRLSIAKCHIYASPGLYSL